MSIQKSVQPQAELVVSPESTAPEVSEALEVLEISEALPESPPNAPVPTSQALVASKKKAHGQTGPKSVAGKNRSCWNALKDGATAKSAVLPFENAQLYKYHILEVEKALNPTNYVEAQMVREYAEGLWRIVRHEKRGAYERERLLSSITPDKVASMLQLEDRYIQSAPDYLINLKYRISKREQDRAQVALGQYRHLLANAKGIANFNMVWRQYPILFEDLVQWAPLRYPDIPPIFNQLGEGLNLPWQRHPQKLLQIIEEFANHLFYVAHFESFKPAIRVWMESWYFLQKRELHKLEVDEQLLLKERNYTYGMLDKLLRFRKSNLYLTSVPANLSVMQSALQAA